MLFNLHTATFLWMWVGAGHARTGRTVSLGAEEKRVAADDILLSLFTCQPADFEAVRASRLDFVSAGQLDFDG